MTSTIEAEGLTKRFGQTQALRGVDLAARPGTVMALLGPNGAGKTTAVRVLATLLKADAGQARICGYDVLAESVQVRQLIALTGQFASVDDELTGTENLLMIGRLLGFSRPTARARGAELLERFELTGAAGRAAKTYSGGMRRRLDLAASLVGEPQVLFLDEPTTGLDPRAPRVQGQPDQQRTQPRAAQPHELPSPVPHLQRAQDADPHRPPPRAIVPVLVPAWVVGASRAVPRAGINARAGEFTRYG